MELQIIVALIGCIPGLLIPVLTEIQERSKQKKLLNKLEFVNKRIEVIEKLLKIYKEYPNKENSSEKQTKSLYKQLSIASGEIISLSTIDDISSKKLSNFEKLFLLYTPKSIGGWWFHIPFYMILGMLFFLWVVVLISSFNTNLIIPYGTYLIVTLIALIILFVLQITANRIKS